MADLLADELSGWPSRELDRDSIIQRRGSNQNLTDDANHHDDDGTNIWTEHSNAVQAGQLPRTSGPVLGSPSAVQPAGSNDTSLVG